MIWTRSPATDAPLSSNEAQRLPCYGVLHSGLSFLQRKTFEPHLENRDWHKENPGSILLD